MIVSLHHASFTVENLERSVAFYTDIMGLKLEGIWERDPGYAEGVTGISGARIKLAYFTLPNASFELVEYLGSRGTKIDTATNNIGSAHVCLVVDDFDAFLDRLKERGVLFPGVVCTIPEGSNKGKKIAYVEDPDGNTLELVSSKAIA